MGRRKGISSALHSELTEYNALLRTLRANNQLNVASHLVRTASSQSNTKKELDGGDNLTEQSDASKSPSPGEGDSTAYSHEVSRLQTARSNSPADEEQLATSRKRKHVHSPQYHKGNIWTRWPLLIDDVHIPEWSFQDEMNVLASNAMKARSCQISPTSESPDQGEDDALTDDTELNSSFLPHLTDAASNYLSTILALLMAHAPNRAWSMQNRVEPMDWLTVLNVLSSCRDPNLADPTIISFVQTRMEALLGPIDDKPSEDTSTSGHAEGTDPVSDRSVLTHRMQQLTEARRKKAKDELSELMKTLFTFPKPPA